MQPKGVPQYSEGDDRLSKYSRGLSVPAQNECPLPLPPPGNATCQSYIGYHPLESRVETTFQDYVK